MNFRWTYVANMRSVESKKKESEENKGYLKVLGLVFVEEEV